MMGIGFPELMVILVIIMIIFGAGKLPQIGSAFGQSIRNFKTSMKEAEAVEEGESQESLPETAGANVVNNQEEAGAPSNAQATAPSAGIPKTPTAVKPASPPAPATKTAAQPASPQKKAAPSKGKKKMAPGEKSFEEELIEQAIKELKDKRVGTIRTPHDGLVQQGDVFTKSVDKTPWHMKGRDKGVNRDVI